MELASPNISGTPEVYRHHQNEMPNIGTKRHIHGKTIHPKNGFNIEILRND